MQELKIDEQLRDLFPHLTPEEFELLEGNILRDGCRDPLTVWNGYIVDGHNRYNICSKHGIEFQTFVLGYTNKDDVIQWMIDTQLGRRNLTPIQRVAIAERYRPVFVRKAQENMILGGGDQKTKIPSDQKVDTREELAKIAVMSHDTYNKAKRILESDNEEIKEKLARGEIKIGTAYRELFGSNKQNRKSIPQTTVKHLINKSGGKCEICDWGGLGLEGVLIYHHINKYSNTKTNSVDELIMICPNCHGLIHTLENCKDSYMTDIIIKSLNETFRTDIIKYASILNSDI